MRISDWSSDVCSSDLLHLLRGLRERGGQRIGLDPAEIAADRLGRSFGILSEIFERLLALLDFIHQPLRIARNLVEPVGGGAEEDFLEMIFGLAFLRLQPV